MEKRRALVILPIVVDTVIIKESHVSPIPNLGKQRHTWCRMNLVRVMQVLAWKEHQVPGWA